MQSYLDDHQLLWEHSCRGKPEALEALSDLVGQVAARELSVRGAAVSDRDDLTQETVRRVLACIDRLPRPPRNLNGFLKYRVRDVLKDYFRAMKRLRGQPGLSDIPHPTHEGAGPEAASLRAEELLALRRCLQRLGKDRAELVELRYFRSMPTGTIAARYGIEPGSVYVRLFRALRSLEECMKGKGFGPEVPR